MLACADHVEYRDISFALCFPAVSLTMPTVILQTFLAAMPVRAHYVGVSRICKYPRK